VRAVSARRKRARDRRDGKSDIPIEKGRGSVNRGDGAPPLNGSYRRRPQQPRSDVEREFLKGSAPHGTELNSMCPIRRPRRSPTASGLDVQVLADAGGEL
jgi:hypothetical protein